ncbi:LUD domain-containing protein [Haloarculaceae archaeon H-GB2-1]|nr:LUD domain-containing protein [Haloarculaceae archaeon H-GB1-1]MEA5407955.1 LUD domain-containing protein [Haloarculaceae archaeon H-GB2-1]
MSPAHERSTMDRFTERLADFDVSYTLTAPDDVAAAIEDVTTQPAIGVELPDGLGDLPESVETDPSPAELREASTGVTEARLGIADYGSLVLPTTADGVEPISLFPEHHVGVVSSEDVVPGMADALADLGECFRDASGSAVVATGPSATADMGALVKGAHGPKTVHAIIVEP